MIEDRDIIFLSSISWEFSRQRHQQLASRFARKNRVLFVEPPASLFLFFHSRELFQSACKKIFSGVREEEKNLFLYAPPPVFPGGRYSFSIQRWNQKSFTRSVRKVINRLKFSSPLIWNMAPYYPAAGLNLGPGVTLYDCVDEAVGGRGRKAHVIQTLENEALTGSNLVLTTSRYLYQTRGPFNPRTFLIPNGSDFDRFQMILEEEDKPLPDLDGCPSPRIGYSGTLNDRIDMELVRFIASQRPSWSFIFIGFFNIPLGGLKDLPNVHLLGFKSAALLPHYLKKLSLGILPYRLNKATRAIHPVKAYDYLSVGLPVVSTPLPECDYFKGLIKVARSPEEFLNGMERELKRDNPELHRQRMEFARENTWDERVEEISRILNEFV